MLVIGIDVGKEELVACLQQSLSGAPPRVIGSLQTVANTASGHNKLVRWLEKQLPRVSRGAPIADDIRYGLSHWEGLTRFLDEPIALDADGKGQDPAQDEEDRRHAVPVDQQRTRRRPEQEPAVGRAQDVLARPLGMGHQADHVARGVHDAGDVGGGAVGVGLPGAESYL